MLKVTPVPAGSARVYQPRERALLDKANKYLPGGVVTDFGASPDPELVVERAFGATLYDVSGNKYIDYLLGAGVQILGHAHPAVVRAVSERLACGAAYYALNEPAILLAEELCRVVPCAEMVKFWNSGSEATSHAMRLARAFTGREKIVKFEGAWFGGYDWALMSIAPQSPPDFPTPVPDSAGIPSCITNEILIAPFNDLVCTTHIVERFADEIAAVVVEPYQRYIAPEPGFLEGLRQLTNRHGILLVFDEIVTGFRFLYGGVQERYGVIPDLAAFGKIIGGGFPLSAVCGRREVMEGIDPRFRGTDKFVHSTSTFSGHSIAATAGLATLAELKQPGVYAQLHEYGAKLRTHMSKTLEYYGLPARVMGDGPIFHVLFTREAVTDYRSTLGADASLLARFQSELLRRGILKGPKGYISTAHTEEQLRTTCQAVDEVAELLAKSRRN
jgi:glutamate-1-semialdehyde 2,1-aminomutase